MSIPNFFIIGAPKCGTTSLADWLSQHPGIFMCRPKEPHYYSPELVAYPVARSKVWYENLFATATPDQLLGEASTGYLRSRNAVARILDDNPDAKLIVCLRNPIEMAPSVHAQLLKGGQALEKNFEESWRKQEIIPGGGHVKETIMTVCRLGEQVKHLLAVANRNQVMFLLLEDLRSTPGDNYARILEFIGAPCYEKVKFNYLNRREHPRSLILARAASFGWRLKRKMGLSISVGMGNFVAKHNNRVSVKNRRVMSREIYQSLHDAFDSNISLLESLIDRDLSAWRHLDVR
jgi:hypothetical protein